MNLWMSNFSTRYTPQVCGLSIASKYGNMLLPYHIRESFFRIAQESKVSFSRFAGLNLWWPEGVRQGDGLITSSDDTSSNTHVHWHMMSLTSCPIDSNTQPALLLLVSVVAYNKEFRCVHTYVYMYVQKTVHTLFHIVRHCFTKSAYISTMRPLWN